MAEGLSCQATLLYYDVGPMAPKSRPENYWLVARLFSENQYGAIGTGNANQYDKDATEPAAYHYEVIRFYKSPVCIIEYKSLIFFLVMFAALAIDICPGYFFYYTNKPFKVYMKENCYKEYVKNYKIF